MLRTLSIVAGVVGAGLAMSTGCSAHVDGGANDEAVVIGNEAQALLTDCRSFGNGAATCQPVSWFQTSADRQCGVFNKVTSSLTTSGACPAGQAKSSSYQCCTSTPNATDAGTRDAAPSDAATSLDAATTDAGTSSDAGPLRDAGTSSDAGASRDASPPALPPGICPPISSNEWSWLAVNSATMRGVVGNDRLSGLCYDIDRLMAQSSYICRPGTRGVGIRPQYNAASPGSSIYCGTGAASDRRTCLIAMQCLP